MNTQQPDPHHPYNRGYQPPHQQQEPQASQERIWRERTSKRARLKKLYNRLRVLPRILLDLPLLLVNLQEQIDFWKAQLFEIDQKQKERALIEQQIKAVQMEIAELRGDLDCFRVPIMEKWGHIDQLHKLYDQVETLRQILEQQTKS